MAIKETDFIRLHGWNISAWKPEDTYRTLVGYLFQEKSTLLIGAGQQANTYTISWIDQNQQLHSIDGFTKDPDPMKSEIDRPQFMLEAMPCVIKLTIDPALDPNSLECSIMRSTLHHGDEPVGTFTAHAGSGEGVVGAARLEESLAV